MADSSFLDWPFFEDSHRALADGLERWCEAELTDDEPDDLDQACRDLVRKLGEGGWLRYCVPAAYGGAHEALDVRSLALVRETLARHSASTSSLCVSAIQSSHHFSSFLDNSL